LDRTRLRGNHQIFLQIGILVGGEDQIEEKSPYFLKNWDFWWWDKLGWDEMEEEPPDFPKN